MFRDSESGIWEELSRAGFLKGSLKQRQSEVGWGCSHPKAWPELKDPGLGPLKCLVDKLDWLLSRDLSSPGSCLCIPTQGSWFPSEQNGECKALYYFFLIKVCCVCAQLLSHVWLFVAPWTVAHQSMAPLSMEFSRQEYWSGLPSPAPRYIPNPGIEPASLAAPALAGRFFTSEPPGKPLLKYSWFTMLCQSLL